MCCSTGAAAAGKHKSFLHRLLIFVVVSLPRLTMRTGHCHKAQRIIGPPPESSEVAGEIQRDEVVGMAGRIRDGGPSECRLIDAFAKLLIIPYQCVGVT